MCWRRRSSACIPEAKLAIGPAIDNGFYYDFDVDEPFTPEVLADVEKEMQKIIKKNVRMERFELPRAEALELMKDEPYKVELINDLPEDATLSFYRAGRFHRPVRRARICPTTGRIKAVQAHAASPARTGAADEKNKMLQRIYGTAFTNKAASWRRYLDAH